MGRGQRQQPLLGSISTSSRTKEDLSDQQWEEMLSHWAAHWDQLSEEALDSIIGNAPAIYEQLAAMGRTDSGSPYMVENCNMACELWLSTLRSDGIKSRIVGGYYSPDDQVEDGALKGDHTWLEIEGYIVDPTAAQFAQGDDFSFDNYRPQHYWDRPMGDKIWEHEWPEYQPWSSPDKNRRSATVE